MTNQADTASVDASRSNSSPRAERPLAEVFVTRKCCGGGTCRNIAPEIFGEVRAHGTDGVGPTPQDGTWEPGAFTGVISQPSTQDEYDAARTAAAACGFGAIRLGKPHAKRNSGDRKPIWGAWPRQLDENVWALGQPSKSNYGAFAYFIEHPNGGVLVDLPRPNDELFESLDAHGGVRTIFLTHKDHVQHHADYAARFPGARRVLGRDDVNRFQTPFTDKTTDVEVTIPSDRGPCTLDGSPVDPSAISQHTLVVLPQPGHTPGGLCLLYDRARPVHRRPPRLLDVARSPDRPPAPVLGGLGTTDRFHRAARCVGSRRSPELPLGASRARRMDAPRRASRCARDHRRTRAHSGVDARATPRKRAAATMDSFRSEPSQAQGSSGAIGHGRRRAVSGRMAPPPGRPPVPHRLRARPRKDPHQNPRRARRSSPRRHGRWNRARHPRRLTLHDAPAGTPRRRPSRRAPSLNNRMIHAASLGPSSEATSMWGCTSIDDDRVDVSPKPSRRHPARHVCADRGHSITPAL